MTAADLKQQRYAQLRGWLAGGKAPTQPQKPKRAKLIRKRGDLPQFQQPTNKGSYF